MISNPNSSKANELSPIYRILTEPAGFMKEDEAFGRFVFREGDDGELQREPSEGTLVDKYGLPLLDLTESLSDERLLDLRWAAVLLDYPYTPERLIGQRFHWASVMNFQAQSVLAGRAITEPNRVEYIQRWKDVGFTPELYILLHNNIKSAVERAKQMVRTAERQFWLDERLEFLHLHTGKIGLKGENLQPEHWADLPALLCRVRPSIAITKILLFGMDELPAE